MRLTEAHITHLNQPSFGALQRVICLECGFSFNFLCDWLSHRNWHDRVEADNARLRAERSITNWSA